MMGISIIVTSSCYTWSLYYYVMPFFVSWYRVIKFVLSKYCCLSFFISIFMEHIFVSPHFQCACVFRSAICMCIYILFSFIKKPFNYPTLLIGAFNTFTSKSISDGYVLWPCFWFHSSLLFHSSSLLLLSMLVICWLFFIFIFVIYFKLMISSFWTHLNHSTFLYLSVLCIP